MNITDMKKEVKAVIDNCALTHEQAMMNLSSIPLNYVEFFDTTPRFRELQEAGVLCTMSEGNGTYAPRYILPDYEKLMREGCKFLRLDPLPTCGRPSPSWKSSTSIFPLSPTFLYIWDRWTKCWNPSSRMRKKPES